MDLLANYIFNYNSSFLKGLYNINRPLYNLIQNGHYRSLYDHNR